jgi:hypothetical protein
MLMAYLSKPLTCVDRSYGIGMLLKALGLSGSVWLIALEAWLNIISEHWRREQKHSTIT